MDAFARLASACVDYVFDYETPAEDEAKRCATQATRALSDMGYDVVVLQNTSPGAPADAQRNLEKKYQ
jgi:hypothetical protein